MIRKVKFSNGKKIKVAEIEISKYLAEFEIEPSPIVAYPVDYLNLYNDDRLFKLEAKILIKTQEWQIAVKENFDELLESSKNPKLTSRMFNQLPEMLVDKVLATHVFILNNLKQDDWKDSITDYIDYVVDSFGKVPSPLMVPAGMNEYIINLQDELINKGWGKYSRGFEDRLCFVLNYISKTYVKDEVERKNFEMLLDVYDKWYHIFPFDIKLFSKVKENYCETLPILKMKPRINPYLGTGVYIFYTENEMLSNLLSITENTLASFKSKELVKKRSEYIRNDAKFNLELINKQHWLDQQDLLTEFSSGKSSYLYVVKKWLSSETKYLKRVLKNYNLNNNYPSFKIQIDKNKWSQDRLIYFKESLENKGFINPIFPSSFKRIFLGEIINKKIVWLKTPTDLAYLISQLIKIEVFINEKDKVSKVKKKLLEPTPQKHWDITARCFKKENGLRFTPSDFRKLDKPANTYELDLALKQLTQ